MELDLTPRELLTTTRTVRKRLDLERPVERDVVEECLRIAFQAPNGSNQQDYGWVVVDDPDMRARMAELLGIPYPAQRQAGLFPIAYTIGTDFKPADRTKSEQRIFWNGWSPA